MEWKETDGLHEKKKAEKSSGRYKTRSPGKKLKNETSARKAMRGKIRHGKADVEMSAAEKKALKKLQVQGRSKIRSRAAAAEIHQSISEQNQDENVGTKALNDGTEAAENTVSAMNRRRYSGNGGKLAGNARAATAKTEASEKSLMKKEFQAAANKKSAAEAANQIGSKTKKFVDKAEDLMGRFGEWVAETLAEHPMIAVAAVIILILLLVFSGILSSCSMIGGGAGNTMVGTSYTAEDDQILAAEADYKDKESALQAKIDSIETDYPGYDEYRYDLAEINHNPYQLAALLTVLYENYTEAEVQTKLQEIFERQYKLTTQAVTEIRTRTETRTGHRTIHHADGTSEDEDYTYEVEVQYEYHILKVTLTNATMDTVARNLGLTDSQTERYEILLQTRGNKPYLFGDDIYSNPDPGDYQDYDIPSEALTNERFANMIREAEKYLGYPYVWGGSSPSTSFDCSGFVSWVINHCGNGWSIGRQTANGLLSHCTRISRDEAQPGDLIFFQGTYDTAGASHVGIYVGNGMMIHCGNPIQYSSIDTNYWRKHFYTFGRIND
jgi:cell wall-associated NlpC family hydrolase